MAKAFLKFPVTNLEALVEHWQNYISSPEYQMQRLKHLPKNQRNETACQPPVSSQTNGTAADQDAVANNDSIDAVASNDSIPFWGRGSRHHEELADLRRLHKKVLKGKADVRSVAWYNSGGLNRRLEQMTLEHGSGRYWDQEGNQIDLRQYAFEDHMEQSDP